MWVLSTARAELHYFFDSAAVTGGYAILSHTWTLDPAGEQTLQDVRKIIEQCKVTGSNPRDCVGEKIRRCCEIAESDGYTWIWIDSCCIDKTSSMELSEAIRSMFNWYALAEVCYVYLEDVGDEDGPDNEYSDFQNARWHSRGWTLQELLAPAFAIFFSKNWVKIGTKYELRHPLSKCTEIQEEYLTRKRDFRVDASIARRMSWAATRKTTRVEDEAYCLLGLFDINMPTMYGEGRHAFQRLQAELARQSTDATLFAWGGCHSSSDDELKQGPLSESQRHDLDEPYIFLFASSPSRFIGWPNTKPSPWTPSPAGLGTAPNPLPNEKHKDNPPSQAHGEVPSFEVTSYGMKCHFPVAEVDGVTIAILPCRSNDDRLGLFLHPAPNDHIQGSSTRQLYYVSWSFRTPTGSGYWLMRLTCLGRDDDNLRFRGKPVAATWREIYIAAHPPTTGRTDGAHLLQGFLPDVAPAVFRIPRTLMQTLAALEFFPDTRMVSWDRGSEDSVSFICQNTQLVESVSILLGTCTKSKSRPCHWAWAEHTYNETWGQLNNNYAHDCKTDHIEGWDSNTREFGDAERTIRLMFVPCTHAPEQTLVLGLELVGSRYEEIQKDANIRLPPPASYLHRLVDAAATSDLPSSCSLRTNSTPASTSPPSYRSTAPVSMHSVVSLRIGSLQTARQSSESSSASTSIEDLHDLSIDSTTVTGSGETHRRATPDSGSNSSTGIRSSLWDAVEDRLRENNANLHRKIQEIKDAHDAQTRKLNAELAQLKALLTQISLKNGAAPPQLLH